MKIEKNYAGNQKLKLKKIENTQQVREHKWKEKQS